MLLGDALAVFLLDCEARGLSAKTTSFYRQQLTPALTWLEGQRVPTLEGITVTHLRLYLVMLSKGGLSPSSQHARARSLRAFLNFAEREDLLPGKNPARRLRMPKRERKLLPALSLEDVSQLLRATGGSLDPLRDRAIILTLTDTGVRASELCGLTIGDLVGERLFVRHGKGGKDRAVFIGDLTRGALAAYLATRPGARPGEPLFVKIDGRGRRIGDALSYEGLKELLKRLGQRSGVVVHAHMLRRTFAVESLRGGCDLVRLARLMGHNSLQMLHDHYLPLVEDDLAAAHRASSPVARLGGLEAHS